MTRILSLLFLCFSLVAQDVSVPRYLLYKETVLSGSAEVVTLRRTTTNKLATLLEGYVYCSAACIFTVERNGTYSSGSNLTPAKLASRWGDSGYLGSSGTSISGTTILITYNVAAGSYQPLNLEGMFLTNSGDSVTIRTNSITGTVRIGIKYQEN